MPLSSSSAAHAGAIIAATVLLVAAAVAMYLQYRRERRVHPSTLLWTLPFVASEIGLLVCINMDLTRPSAAVIQEHTLITFICGLVPFARRPIINWLDRQRGHAPHIACAVRDAVLMFAASILSVVSLEMACNKDNLGSIGFKFFFAAALIVFLIMVILYFVGQRFGVLPCLAVILCCGMGIAEYFVIKFKGAAILPSDILAIGTAMAVSEGYEFTFAPCIIYSLNYAIMAIALLSLVSPIRPADKNALIMNVAVNVICAVFAITGAFGLYTNVKLEDALEFSYDRWWPISSYSTYGFIPTFTATAQNFEIEEPEDYDHDETEELQSELAAQYDATRGTSEERQAAVAQYNELHPTVITVMDESFSDLSYFDALREVGYFGPSYYNSISDALIRGDFYTSICGGGTANTEFEYMTNDSLGFIGNGKYPYSLYDLTNVDSLAKQLASDGYKTLAMHPSSPDNWNRRTAYKRLGLSKFLDIEDFEGAPGYHSGSTDGSTYEKILEQLADDSASQFILDVTIQNHGGYGAGTVPDEDLTSYYPAGLSEDTTSALNVYLTCIEKSDEDLEWFIDQLRQLDRPVVLVFFGDHQPTVASSVNDELYQGEGSFAHTERLYSSTYFVWANYDVAGCEQVSANETIGANELSARVLDLIGAPLTSYQKALLATRSEVVALSGVKYLGADGVVYPLDAEGAYAETVDKIRRLQYLNFVENL